MNRNIFTCAARGCEGGSVCEDTLKEISHQRKVIHELRAQALEKALRAEKLEELLTRIIDAHDLGSRDDLLHAIGRAADYLNG